MQLNNILLEGKLPKLAKRINSKTTNSEDNNNLNAKISPRRKSAIYQKVSSQPGGVESMQASDINFDPNSAAHKIISGQQSFQRRKCEPFFFILIIH